MSENGESDKMGSLVDRLQRRHWLMNNKESKSEFVRNDQPRSELWKRRREICCHPRVVQFLTLLAPGREFDGGDSVLRRQQRVDSYFIFGRQKDSGSQRALLSTFANCWYGQISLGGAVATDSNSFQLFPQLHCGGWLLYCLKWHHDLAKQAPPSHTQFRDLIHN